MVPSGVTLRTMLFPVSAMYRFPLESKAIAFGEESSAAVAGPLSPALPVWPVPAKGLIAPSVPTTRTRLSAESAMYRLPAASTARDAGADMVADLAGPPSPPEPRAPLPATTHTIPLESIRTTWCAPLSATNRSPLLPATTALGVFRSAEAA